MVAPTSDEQVRYDIIIEAKAALQSLRDMLKVVNDNKLKVLEFSQVIQQQSKMWGVSWQYALGVYKQLNAELSKSKQATLFGNVGGKDLFKDTENYLGSLEQAGRLQSQVGTSAQEMGEKTENATKRAVRGVDAMRIALGVLVSMLIFQVIQAVQNAFSQMVNNIKESELAIYNLINAERRLSEQGIEVNPKGLQDIINSVQTLVPILSKIQAQELVSRIATNVAPALHLTTEQIKQMAEATALLYIRNKALGKSFDEVESQLTNAFLTGKVSVGINQLGVKVSDQIVRDEALRMGLVKTAKEFDNLSGEAEAHVKAVAMLSVVYKNATQDIGSVSDYMQTFDAQSELTKKSWSDFLTTLGQVFGPALSEGLKVVSNGIQFVISLLEKAKPLFQQEAAYFVAFMETAKGTGNQIFTPQGFLALVTSQKFADNLDKVKKSFQELGDAADTPTAAIDSMQEAMDKFDAEGFKQKVDDILADAQNSREDLATKFGQKRSDIDLEYQRKAADAEKDYNRKVQDINRDAEREIANLKEKQRQDDLKAEEDYQLRLWELRMRFLMDLEDALHARDARQVIRLQKQYEIDKEALARKQALDDKQRAADQKNALEDIEIKRKQRLEDAKIEYQQKLDDQRVAKQRELDDLNVWYQQELSDLQQNIQRKLQTLIQGWIEEQKITESNAAQVYAILYKYFGPGGMTDALYAYMASKLSMSAAVPISSLPYNFTSQPTSTTQKAKTDTQFQRHNFAEGGTLLATRPTTVTFGENGPEMGQFTPLTRLGANVGKIFGASGNTGAEGTITVEVLLSPDLEARVVDKSMNGVANVIAKVNRIKP